MNAAAYAARDISGGSAPTKRIPVTRRLRLQITRIPDHVRSDVRRDTWCSTLDRLRELEFRSLKTKHRSVYGMKHRFTGNCQ